MYDIVVMCLLFLGLVFIAGAFAVLNDGYDPRRVYGDHDDES